MAYETYADREKVIEVKDLVISFRTGEGKVQAVRDISFDLYRGETLCIVGESGSGKSVTCKAILGISAVNAMHENGEIIYIDQDLLQINEEDFHRIRGDKIAMVFQDPLSALNPIMRTGKQLTEAIIQNNKVKRKDASKNLKEIHKALDAQLAFIEEKRGSSAETAAYKENLKIFQTIMNKQIHLEFDFNRAYGGALEVHRLAKQMQIDLSNYNDDAVQKSISKMNSAMESGQHPFLLTAADVAELKSLTENYNREHKHTIYAAGLEQIAERLDARFKQDEHDFPALAYVQAADELSDEAALHLDEQAARARYDKEFLNEFRPYIGYAIEHADEVTKEHEKAALEVAKKYAPLFSKRPLDVQASRKALEEINTAVRRAINPLDIIKDSTLYTFPNSGLNALESYEESIKRNKQEEKRYARDLRKHQRAERKGKGDEWSVVPLNLVDLDKQQNSVEVRLTRLIARLEELQNAPDEGNYGERALKLLDYLIQLASDSAYKVTSKEAEDKAIRLMREVGLPRPEQHFKQYPFELSGGMRQRVVIAIALCSDPDVLICDEPTTALDVTIQAQILDLINEIKTERNLSIIFITHDLGVVARMADRVAVMYAGKIVEIGTVEEIYYEPAHPYTWALLASMPDLETEEELDPIPGTPPNMLMPPKGDAFADRNHYAMAIDFEEQPPMFQISDTHLAATWLLHPDAPKVDPPRIVMERIRKKKAQFAEHQKAKNAACPEEEVKHDEQ